MMILVPTSAQCYISSPSTIVPSHGHTLYSNTQDTAELLWTFAHRSNCNHRLLTFVAPRLPVYLGKCPSLECPCSWHERLTNDCDFPTESRKTAHRARTRGEVEGVAHTGQCGVRTWFRLEAASAAFEPRYRTCGNIDWALGYPTYFLGLPKMSKSLKT
jgi:hypothetical protein